MTGPDMNDGDAAQPVPSAGPRAFCLAAGTWYCVWGVLSFVGGACGSAGQVFLSEPLSRVPDQWLALLTHEYQYVGMMAVFHMICLVGGMLLLAIGLGLRAERPASATLALVATAMLTLVHLALAVFWLATSRYTLSLVAGLTSGLYLFLFLTATGCRATFRAHPPPANRNVVTDAQLEAMRKTRKQGYD
jgi:hypothetical protein